MQHASPPYLSPLQFPSTHGNTQKSIALPLVAFLFPLPSSSKKATVSFKAQLLLGPRCYSIAPNFFSKTPDTHRGDVSFFAPFLRQIFLNSMLGNTLSFGPSLKYQTLAGSPCLFPSFLSCSPRYAPGHFVTQECSRLSPIRRAYQELGRVTVHYRV